ncbi:Na/Pi cotransporter family protein [Leeia sp. TBRC 13508]|uniref:Na/Pi cotransporter family protein n=1 Tax=Leeia speluncae TaxID=2884804 RepID=A0ABS8D6P9_9NEIS|nr:Na/Pi cotransporter family protein [Leeia speluncae]MCB6183880.1 Na/Pi cotransporter family protein [Leeia speluncae]
MLVLTQLLGAVALLIWGTHMVQTGLIRAWGGPLRKALGQSVKSRFTAFFTGMGITALIQSGTATTLMVAGFVGQGLITTAAALPIILGADVGSSLVAQFFSLKLVWLSPLLILIGVLLYRANRSQQSRQAGKATAGLGIMMLALQLIGSTMAPISHSDAIQVIFQSITGDTLLDILVAACLTFVAHSSLAIVLLVATLVGNEALSPLLGLALVLGANMGSSMSPLLSGVGSGSNGRQVAIANLVFKLCGIALVAPFIKHAGPWLTYLGDTPERQVLHFHVLFNVFTAAVFLFLNVPVANLCAKLCKSANESRQPHQTKYLDEAALESPELAIACAAREAMRMGDMIDEMLRDTESAICENDDAATRRVEDSEVVIDILYKSVKNYLMRVERDGLSTEDNQRWVDVLSLTINLEHIGDVIDKNLMDLARRKIHNQRVFSETGNVEIHDLHQRLISNLRLGLNLFMRPDVKNAQRLLDEKTQFNQLERRYAENHLQRLAEQRVQSIETSSLHLDVIRDLKRVNSHICSLAYPILENAGKLSSKQPQVVIKTKRYPKSAHIKGA